MKREIKISFRKMNMKKIIIGLIIVISIYSFIETCSSEIQVDPSEISISMSNEFIFGNTSKNIFILNNNSEIINMSWYIEHPTPESWMRPNKTQMPNLSWICLEPKWQIIPENSSKDFYIYLQIPDSDDNYNQSWEVWATFKSDTGGLIQQEYAIRIYIDTPTKSTDEKQDQTSNENDNLYQLPIIIFLIALFSIIAISIINLKKKK